MADGFSFHIFTDICLYSFVYGIRICCKLQEMNSFSVLNFDMNNEFEGNGNCKKSKKNDAAGKSDIVKDLDSLCQNVERSACNLQLEAKLANKVVIYFYIILLLFSGIKHVLLL